MKFGKLQINGKKAKNQWKLAYFWTRKKDSFKPKHSLSLVWFDLGTIWIFYIDLTHQSVVVDSQTMFVQTVNLPFFHHADEEALRDHERLERDEREDEMLADDGVEERDNDEEFARLRWRSGRGGGRNRSSIINYGLFVILRPRYFSILTAGCERDASQRHGVARLGGH